MTNLNEALERYHRSRGIVITGEPLPGCAWTAQEARREVDKIKERIAHHEKVLASLTDFGPRWDSRRQHWRESLSLQWKALSIYERSLAIEGGNAHTPIAA